VIDSLRLVAAPGTFFQYGPSHYYAFAVFFFINFIAALHPVL
jgi:hypothetical protein